MGFAIGASTPAGSSKARGRPIWPLSDTIRHPYARARAECSHVSQGNRIAARARRHGQPDGWLVARKDFPPNTLQELITYLRANEKTVTLAHGGIGSIS